MHYVTVFDIADEWPPIWVVGIGLLLLAFGRLWWRDRYEGRFSFPPDAIYPRPLRPSSDMRALKAAGVFAVGVGWIFVCLAALGTYVYQRHILSAGQATVVEGLAHGFGDLPRGGRHF